MNPWLLAAAAIVASFSAPALVIARGGLVDCVVGLELIGVGITVVLLLLAAGDADPSLTDPAVVLAFLSFGAGLVYARLFERRI